MEIKSGLDVTNKRLDDQNHHLIELSRRIDLVRTELTEWIDTTNEKIDAIYGKIDRLYEVVAKREEHIELSQLYRNIDDRIQKLEKALGKVKTAQMEYESV